MSTSTNCKWWFEKVNGKYTVHRIKSGLQMTLQVAGIVPGESDTNVIKVRTVHPDYGLIEKPFKLTEFQWKENGESKVMEGFLGCGQEFIERWQHLEAVSENTSLEGSAPEEATESPNILLSDACHMDVIKRKQVKLGDIYTIEVPVGLLSCPPPERAVRALNEAHVSQLIQSYKRSEGNVLPTLCVHVANHLPQHINMADVLNGTYVMEVLGGNHTRQALSELRFSENVPIVLYAGLSNDQALYLGYEHNRVHLNNRIMTFEEDVMLFRRKLIGNPDEGLSHSQRIKWRRTMAQILGIDMKQVRNKYRHHTWLASQPSRIWSLIKDTMKAWENKALRGQRPGPLKPFHLSFLEKMNKEEIEDYLRKLINQEVSLQKIKCNAEIGPSVTNKRKHDSSTSEEQERKLQKKEDDLKKYSSTLEERERKLKKKEDDLKEWEHKLVEWEKVLKKQSSELEHGTNEDKEVPMLKMPGGGTCISGDWIAVFYTKTKVPPVGRIVDVDPLNKCATVHFLKGRKMSTGTFNRWHANSSFVK